AECNASGLLGTDRRLVVLDVLGQRDHEHGGAALPTDEHGPGTEHHPLSKPALSVRGDDFGAIALPVLVPLVNGRGVVNATVLHPMSLEASAFSLRHDEAEGAARFRAREDVLRHE